jgi:hypothetical protein
MAVHRCAELLCAPHEPSKTTPCGRKKLIEMFIRANNVQFRCVDVDLGDEITHTLTLSRRFKRSLPTPRSLVPSNWADLSRQERFINNLSSVYWKNCPRREFHVWIVTNQGLRRQNVDISSVKKRAREETVVSDTETEEGAKDKVRFGQVEVHVGESRWEALLEAGYGM